MSADVAADARPASATRNPIDWLLRDRRTGEIVIGQRPNKLILISSVARGLRVVTPKGGNADKTRRAVATGALIVWAVDESVRGVNPLRRMIGASTLVVQIGVWVRQFRR